MEHHGLFTVAQWVKAKGGDFRTSIQSGRLRVEIHFHEQTFVGVTSLNLEGLRTVEKIFSQVTGIEPAQISPAVCGVTRDYLVKQFEGNTFAECLASYGAALRGDMNDKCAHGFKNNVLIGTFGDLAEGKAFKQYRAASVREKIGMQSYIDADGITGSWDDLIYTVSGDDASACACGENLSEIFKLWAMEDYKQLNTTRVTVGDTNRIMEATGSVEDRFFLLLDQAINTWPISEQENIYWGGGVKAVGKNRSVGSVIFPVTEGKIPFGEFFDVAVKRCLEEWEYERKNQLIKSSSVEDLVLGQMLRMKGQLSVDRGQRTLRYDPRPLAYLNSRN